MLSTHLRRNLGVLAGVVLFAPLAAVAYAAPSGSDGSSFVVKGVGESPPLTRALEQDIYAATDGKGVDSPNDSLLWQNDFATVVMQVQGKYPNDYANSGIDAESDTAWISFSGLAPSGALDLIATLPVDVTINQAIGWTEAQMVAIGEYLHYELYTSPLSSSVQTSIDVQTGTIEVAVEAISSASLESVRSVLKRQQPALVAEASRCDVQGGWSVG